MEENFCGGSGWFGAGCWGGVLLSQCPRLGIDTIERASFGLIKWVTALCCRVEDMDPLRGKKGKEGKEKHRTSPKISLARGRDSIERGWVNWKMLLPFCKLWGIPQCIPKCSHQSYQILWWNWLSWAPSQGRPEATFAAEDTFIKMTSLRNLCFAAPRIRAYINASRHLSGRHTVHSYSCWDFSYSLTFILLK